MGSILSSSSSRKGKGKVPSSSPSHPEEHPLLPPHQGAAAQINPARPLPTLSEAANARYLRWEAAQRAKKEKEDKEYDALKRFYVRTLREAAELWMQHSAFYSDKEYEGSDGIYYTVRLPLPGEPKTAKHLSEHDFREVVLGEVCSLLNAALGEKSTIVFLAYGGMTSGWNARPNSVQFHLKEKKSAPAPPPPEDEEEPPAPRASAFKTTMSMSEIMREAARTNPVVLSHVEYGYMPREPEPAPEGDYHGYTDETLIMQ